MVLGVICLIWDLGTLAILHKSGVISLPMLSHVFGTKDSDGKTISYQASKTNSSKKSSLTPPLEILPRIYIIISHTPTSFDKFRICKTGICKILRRVCEIFIFDCFVSPQIVICWKFNRHLKEKRKKY